MTGCLKFSESKQSFIFWRRSIAYTHTQPLWVAEAIGGSPKPHQLFMMRQRTHVFLLSSWIFFFYIHDLIKRLFEAEYLGRRIDKKFLQRTKVCNFYWFPSHLKKRVDKINTFHSISLLIKFLHWMGILEEKSAIVSIWGSMKGHGILKAIKGRKVTLSSNESALFTTTTIKIAQATTTIECQTKGFLITNNLVPVLIANTHFCFKEQKKSILLFSLIL